MAKYPNITLTNAGLSMIAESQGSGQLIFTAIKLGDGSLNAGEDIKALTDLKNPMVTAAISNIDNSISGQVSLTTVINNSTVTTGFFGRELGVYAKVGTNGTEKLYAYTNAGNYADYMPDKNTPIDENQIKITLIVGNASSVTALINSSIVYPTQEEMMQAILTHNESSLSHANVINNHNMATDAHAYLQEMIKTKGNNLLRNIPVFGPLSEDKVAAYLTGVGANQITVKAGTQLSFAAGISDNGPLEHVMKVPTDINLTLAAAGISTVPLSYTANLCVGGTAISSGDLDASHLKSIAFDGATNSGWRSSTSATAVNGVGYIGYVFANAVRIRKIRIDHVDNEYVTSVKIQYSDDGTTWNTAGTFATGAYTNYGTIPDCGAHKYWRVLANSNSNNGTGSPAYWYVGEVEMYEALQTYYIYADRNKITGVITLGSTKQRPRIADISDIYTDNLCIGGAAISSGDYNTTNSMKELAFDGNALTSWSSEVGTAFTSRYIGYDFGVARHIRRLVAAFNIFTTSAKVQRSTDGNTWYDVLTVNVSSGANIFDLPASAAARYWRIIGNSTTRTDGNTSTANSIFAYDITMHEIATELLHYSPTENKSRWHDGNNWTDVERIPLGSVNVDSAGKIVGISMNPYGLSRVRALPAEGADDAVTLGQFLGQLATNGCIKIPVLVGSIKTELIIQWGRALSVASNAQVNVTLPTEYKVQALFAIGGRYEVNGGGSACYESAVWIISNSQIGVRNDSGHTHDISWLVIGI